VINFDTLEGQASVVVRETPTLVTEKVTIKPVAAPAAHLLQDEGSWDWRALRDYVVREIERRHGPQVHDDKKEAAIFKSFLTRWEGDAVRIAKAAFELYEGMWGNAPISVTRFCKGSDEFFAAKILTRLER
jgi:hypothetical protein